MSVKVKIYLDEGAQMPTRKHNGDYCWDLTAISRLDDTAIDKPHKGAITYDTGVHIAPEPSFKGCGNGFARSSVCFTGLVLSNGEGIIDRNYRGSIKAVFYVATEDGDRYNVGDRILQFALSTGEEIEWVRVNSLEELGETDRGDGGYGSSGR